MTEKLMSIDITSLKKSLDPSSTHNFGEGPFTFVILSNSHINFLRLSLSSPVLFR